MEFYDLAVIGGGSGGFGAALAAARWGLRVVLIEAAPMLGGNSTLGGVNIWEPGIGGPGFHGELYERLLQIPDAIALSRTTKFYSSDAPWGLSQPQRGLIYRNSLRRSAIPPDKWTRVIFEPEIMARMMAAMLEVTGKVTLRLNTRFVAVHEENRWVRAIEIESGGQREKIEFRYIVDATAQLHVATMNALPVMEGWEWQSLPPADARAECERRVRRIWRTFQKEYGFDRYRLKQIFPLTGVREGPRLVGRRVLTENDVRGGVSCYSEPDSITIADHALDTHGEGHLCQELNNPYGVPFDCLLPREVDNLLVACRGASFSHLAASSCRLSRTMMQLGHAAGLAACSAWDSNCAPTEVVEDVQMWLARDDVALTEWDNRFLNPDKRFDDLPPL